MNSDDRGYVTVEHAIGFVAVTLVVGVIDNTIVAFTPHSS